MSTKMIKTQETQKKHLIADERIQENLVNLNKPTRADTQEQRHARNYDEFKVQIWPKAH